MEPCVLEEEQVFLVVVWKYALNQLGLQFVTNFGITKRPV